MNSKQPHDPARTLGDIMTEPDLKEHQRLIHRARTQNAACHLARPARDAGASPWSLVVVATLLLFLWPGSPCCSCNEAATRPAELARAQHRTAAEQVRFMLERALAAHAIKQSSRDHAP